MKEIYKDCPFYGVPRLTHELHRRGYGVNHKRVRRLQREMGMLSALISFVRKTLISFVPGFSSESSSFAA